MAKFFIEVPHEANKNACYRAAQTLLRTGSHFITNADFGCLDGEHKAWITVEVPNKESAKYLLPTEYRSTAKIIELHRFSLEEINEFFSHHEE
jgi:hypothetical protein